MKDVSVSAPGKVEGGRRRRAVRSTPMRRDHKGTTRTVVGGVEDGEADRQLALGIAATASSRKGNGVSVRAPSA